MIIDENIKFNLMEASTPSKTIKGYKLFKLKNGKLYPLYVNADKSIPVGEWVEAEAGELLSSGKVKAKISGGLAFRPGWHSGEIPIAHHIGGKSHGNPKLPPDYRRDDEVWAEVEVADDVDWQSEANKRAKMTKAGKINKSTAHITDQVPKGGFYRYKTNSNMTGNWLISGEMKINKILSDKEVDAINKRHNVKDLPRLPKERKNAMKEHTELLGKAILDVSNQAPKDFSDKVEEVLQAKLKSKVTALVKDEESKIFKKHK